MHEGRIGICRRCAKRVRKGRWHDLYECSANDAIDHKPFRKATRIVQAHLPAGSHEELEASVFWMRGVMPRRMLAEFDGPSMIEALFWESEIFVDD